MAIFRKFIGLVFAATLTALLAGMSTAVYLPTGIDEKTLAGMLLIPVIWLLVVVIGLLVRNHARFIGINLALEFIMACLLGVAALS